MVPYPGQNQGFGHQDSTSKGQGASGKGFGERSDFGDEGLPERGNIGGSEREDEAEGVDGARVSRRSRGVGSVARWVEGDDFRLSPVDCAIGGEVVSVT